MQSKNSNNDIKESTKEGAVNGGVFGLGLGLGIGVCANAAGNSFNRIILPVVTTVYSKWGFTRPGATLPYIPMIKTVSKFGIAGGIVGGTVGAIIGTGIGFFTNKKNQRVSQSKNIIHEKDKLISR